MSADIKQMNLPAVPEAPNGMVAMMERLALNPDLPVEKLRELLAMQMQIRAVESESAFNTAMSACQGEMGRISADAHNPQTNSRYASYGKLDSVLRPIYTKHGFAVSFDEDTSKQTPDTVTLMAYVSHNGGHTRTYRKVMPIVTTGIKGNAMMTPTHGRGSADSYGKRYLLKDIFNVAIGEDDNDGNQPKDHGPTITEEQAANLLLLCEQADRTEAQLCKHLKVAKLTDLPQKEFGETVAMLKAKVRK